MELLQQTRPKDIKLPFQFYGAFAGTGDSKFGATESEMIAKNIVIISRKENKWQPFSWNEYCLACSHEATKDEKYILDRLVRQEYLSFNEGKYSITESFLEALKEYIE